MKATGVEQAAPKVEALLSPHGYVVTLQNSIVEHRVAGILGAERVVGALVGWGATMHAPGVYEMTSRGELVVAELDGQVTPRLEEFRATLDTAAPDTIYTNIHGVLWSKLDINCVITLQTLERGRHPEIDFMNSYVVGQGREVGVPVPVNEALTFMVREIEQGERQISPQNLQIF
jgi:ketopantoate reductase